MSELSSARPIVIDNGTGYSKNGFAGEKKPRSIFPTLVGVPRYKSIMPDVHLREYYVGDEALQLRGVLELSHPIQWNLIEDWDALEKLWCFTFFEDLRVNPSEHPILLTKSFASSRANNEKMAEVMFEVFNIPALYIADQAVLSLYASGRTTGLVVESGESFTRVVPIYEGFIISHAASCIGIAGRAITDYFRRLIFMRGFGTPFCREGEIVRDIKEALCYVALNPTKEAGRPRLQKQYLLPSGSSLSLDVELFQAPEAFFDPGRIDSEEPPLHELVYKCIRNCDIDLRAELYSNIILSGGSTLFPGFSERLHKELRRLAPKSVKLRILSPPYRYYSAWLGGSLLSSSKPFSSKWLTKHEYWG